ncbi:MAG: peptidylprolyl isomerase [Thermodesulfobacteriota bacterium]
MTLKLSACLLFACTVVFAVAVAPAVHAQTANRIVAFVNDDVITLYELHNKMREMTGIEANQLRERSPIQYHDSRLKVLERLIEERIALDKIKEIGIKVGESEVDAAIERVKRDNRWTGEKLESMLEADGLTVEEYRKKLKEEIQRQKLVDFEVKSRIIIRDENIEAYYEENKDQFQRKPGIELATIFLTSRNPNDSQSAAELEKKGAELLERLRNGEGFARMAEAYSDGPAAKEGGYLGRFNPDQLEPEIREVVEKTPEGGISDIIIKPNGIQIIKVLDKGGTGVVPLERVKDAIHRILFNQEVERRYKKWIEELKERAYTKILIE